MITVFAKVTPKENMADNIINEAKNLIRATCEEEGCIEYNLYTPVNEKDNLLFVEKWTDKEHLESHLKQPHFVKFGSDIEDYLAKDLDISVYSSEEIEL